MVNPIPTRLSPPALPKLSLTHNRSRIDFKQVRNLLKDSYWVPGIDLKRVRLLAKNSFMVAALLDSKGQVYAYARTVSDGSRFAYLADVIVHPNWRGLGLGKRIVTALLNHPKMQNVDGWLLQTQDAHTLYQGLGFHAPEFPERIMVKRKGEKAVNRNAE